MHARACVSQSPEPAIRIHQLPPPRSAEEQPHPRARVCVSQSPRTSHPCPHPASTSPPARKNSLIILHCTSVTCVFFSLPDPAIRVHLRLHPREEKPQPPSPARRPYLVNRCRVEMSRCVPCALITSRLQDLSPRAIRTRPTERWAQDATNRVSILPPRPPTGTRGT